MLLQNYRGRDCRFQAVSLISFDNFTKRTHRATLSLPVVRHQRQPTLHLCGRAQTLNQIPLGVRERFAGWRCAHVTSNTRTRQYCAKEEPIRTLPGFAMQFELASLLISTAALAR